jgi:membrane protein DedA with SNARE-associated domain
VDRNQRRVILARDITLIVIGAVGMLAQIFLAKEPNGLLISASVTLLLGPTGAALWAQRNNVGPSTIESSSSEPPSSEPQPSSSPPS